MSECGWLHHLLVPSRVAHQLSFAPNLQTPLPKLQTPPQLQVHAAHPDSHLWSTKREMCPRLTSRRAPLNSNIGHILLRKSARSNFMRKRRRLLPLYISESASGSHCTASYSSPSSASISSESFSLWSINGTSHATTAPLLRCASLPRRYSCAMS